MMDNNAPPPSPRPAARLRSDQRGRSVDRKRVQITRNVYTSPAFQSLSPNAVRIWLELLYRFSGGNNGDIGYSVREASRDLKGDRHETPSLSTAKKGFDELIAKGFLIVAKDSSFNMKQAKSRRWTLTVWPLRQGVAPTNDWAHWRPSKSEIGISDETIASVEDTESALNDAD